MSFLAKLKFSNLMSDIRIAWTIFYATNTKRDGPKLNYLSSRINIKTSIMKFLIKNIKNHLIHYQFHLSNKFYLNKLNLSCNRKQILAIVKLPVRNNLWIWVFLRLLNFSISNDFYFFIYCLFKIY